MYDVEDGTRVKFWKHVWCGDCTFQEAFPKLYSLSRSKDSSVAKVMGWSVGGFTGMCNFIVHHKIGNKKPLIGLWGWSIL